MIEKSIPFIITVALLSGITGGFISNKLQKFPGASSGSTIVQPVEMKLIDEKSAVIDAIQKVSPSVVSIIITQELKTIRSRGVSPFDLFQNDPFFRQFFGPMEVEPQEPEAKDEKPQRQKVGGGSGFIITNEGLVLTNRHVVSADGAEYTVILSDGTEYPAEIVSRDVFNDIAVIKMVPGKDQKLPELKPVQFGNSSDLKIGQTVIAIGNALAEFQNSATRGIVSAVGRQIFASDGTGRAESLSGLIQTDAAINPGNSGGPLINLAGEVIGVNTAIAQNANGIGFAIPIDDLKPVVKSVIEKGKIVRPILGVMFTMISPDLAKELSLPVNQGALLRGDGKNFAVIPGKPAEKAGLQEQDIITEVNGVKITEKTPLQREISKYAPGEKVKVKYLRKGKENVLEVTLEEVQ